jgi:hypothetical protein
MAREREGAEWLIDHEIVRQPETLDVAGLRLEGIEEALVAMHGDLRHLIGAHQRQHIGNGLARLVRLDNQAVPPETRALPGIGAAEQRTQRAGGLAGFHQFQIGGFHDPSSVAL